MSRVAIIGTPCQLTDMKVIKLILEREGCEVLSYDDMMTDATLTQRQIIDLDMINSSDFICLLAQPENIIDPKEAHYYMTLLSEITSGYKEIFTRIRDETDILEIAKRVKMAS